mgnify:CR=1 FL=1
MKELNESIRQKVIGERLKQNRDKESKEELLKRTGPGFKILQNANFTKFKKVKFCCYILQDFFKDEGIINPRLRRLNDKLKSLHKEEEKNR